MALGPRLDIRQTQQLVMTPQLQQAIKLLALSNLEIETFIGEALEANPLLEVGSETQAEASPLEDAPPREEAAVDRMIDEGMGQADQPLDIDPGTLDIDRDTGDGSLFGAAARRSQAGRKGWGSTSAAAGIPAWSNISGRSSARRPRTNGPASSPPT